MNCDNESWFTFFRYLHFVTHKGFILSALKIKIAPILCVGVFKITLACYIMLPTTHVGVIFLRTILGL